MIKAEANVIGTIKRSANIRTDTQSVFVICHDSRCNGC